MPFVRGIFSFACLFVCLLSILLIISHAFSLIISELYFSNVVIGEVFIFGVLIFSECQTSVGGIVMATVLISLAIAIAVIMIFYENRMVLIVVGNKQSRKLLDSGGSKFNFLFYFHFLFFLGFTASIRICVLLSQEYFAAVINMALALSFFAFVVVCKRRLFYSVSVR